MPALWRSTVACLLGDFGTQDTDRLGDAICIFRSTQRYKLGDEEIEAGVQP
jgi:hypothetical protein